MKKLNIAILFVVILFLFSIVSMCADDDYSNGNKMILTAEEYLPGLQCPVKFFSEQIGTTNELLNKFNGKIEPNGNNKNQYIITLPNDNNETKIEVTLAYTNDTTDEGHNLRQKIVNKLMRFDLILYYLQQCKETFLECITEENVKKPFSQYYDKVVCNIFRQGGNMHSMLANEFNDTKNKNEKFPTMIEAENIVRNEINSNDILIKLFERYIFQKRENNIEELLQKNNEDNKNNLNNNLIENNNKTTYDILTGITKKEDIDLDV